MGGNSALATSSWVWNVNSSINIYSGERESERSTHTSFSFCGFRLNLSSLPLLICTILSGNCCLCAVAAVVLLLYMGGVCGGHSTDRRRLVQFSAQFPLPAVGLYLSVEHVTSNWWPLLKQNRMFVQIAAATRRRQRQCTVGQRQMPLVKQTVNISGLVWFKFQLCH